MKKTFEFNGATIHYTIKGTGQPVLLLHGFGEDSRVWDNQTSYLQDQCMLIFPDWPGSGLSQNKTNDKQTDEILAIASSIDVMADCAAALLQAENIEKAIVFGHSMGGYVTLAMAEKYPALIAAFGLVHSTAYADTDEKKATRKKGIAFIEKNGAYAFMKTSIPGLFGDAFSQKHPEKVEALIEQSKQFSGDALSAYYEAMIARPDRTDVLRNSQSPVLFIAGKQDKAVPFADTMQQVHLPNISNIHVLEQAAHMGMWEAPQEVSKYLLEFIHENS